VVKGKIMQRSIVTLYLLGALVYTEQVFAWTNPGFCRGTAHDAAIAPSNPDKKFAGTY
jgi:hypothetical protein